MKKLFFTALILLAGKTFSQVTKADFESLFSKFKYDGMSSVYIKNTRTYYTNGTSALEQKEYKTSTISYELKDNAVYLLFYEDNTKAKLTFCMIYPYKNIQTVSGSNKGFTIELME